MVGQSAAFNTLPHDVASSNQLDQAQDQSPQAAARKRRASLANRSGHGSRSGIPTAFALRTEDDLLRSSTHSAVQPHLASSSNFGVKSFESSMSTDEDIYQRTNTGQQDERDEHDRNLACYHSQPRLPESPMLSPRHPQSPSVHSTSIANSPIRTMSRQPSMSALAGSLKPFYLHYPLAGTDSASPSTPRTASLRSLHLSDDDSATDDGRSQALASSDEEDIGDAEVEESVNLPQLVMPSIRMPSRRPFTERGKAIGKLKIAVAGAPGVGKSSLIRAIVQSCEDIVHVDPLKESLSSNNTSRDYSSLGSLHSDTHEHIIETFASTRAYPLWWSELEDNRVLKRRKSSMSEPVLERNICFIDTPGIDTRPGVAYPSISIIEHVEHLLRKIHSYESLTNSEVLSILAGNGGVQVDLVLYMLSADVTTTDLEAMRRLSELTIVVPMLAKADTMSEADVSAAILSISQKIRTSSIRLAFPDVKGSEHIYSTSEPRIWAISSATSRDDEMDASLLMSSGYVQPLASSDLKDMIRTIFNPDTSAWLRHSSAKKFIAWRRKNASQPDELALQAPRSRPPISAAIPSAPSSSSESQVLDSRAAMNLPLPPTTASPYTLARLQDHKHHEERQAQVHLARWATDLQRSLRNERERYEQLQCEEQRGWLIKKWNEGSLENKSDLDLVRTPHLDLRDPLGLIAWDDAIRCNSILVVKVIGGCGMIGAVLLWAMRASGWSLNEHDAGYSWSNTWLGYSR